MAKTPQLNWLDRTIAWINPRAGVQRLQMRAALAAGYDAAQKHRLNKVRDTSGGTGDDTLTHEALWDLRETSRDLYRNNGLFRGLINTGVRNVIGCGWMIKHKDPKVKLLWNRWTRKENCDVRGKQSFWAMMRAGLRAQFLDGDVFYQKRPDYKLMPIEGDRIVSYHGAPVTLINGIQTNRDGKPIRYWVSDRVRNRLLHEGIYYGTAREDQGRYVAGEDIVHQVDLDRFSHTRGVPVAAPMIRDIDDLEAVLVSTRVAAKISAMLSFVITKNQNPAAFADALAARNPEEQIEGEPRVEVIEPGGVQYLNSGEEMKSVGSEHPSPQFENFVRIMSRFIGVPLGIPLELVLLDSSIGNFANMRGVLQQAYKSFLEIQEYSVWPVLDAIYPWWQQWMIDAGELDPSVAETEVKFIASGWPYIDPMKDAKADDMGLKNRTQSRGRILARTGDDWDEIKEELAQEEKDLEELGIPMVDYDYEGTDTEADEAREGKTAKVGAE